MLVSYVEVRQQIHDGDIVFINGSSWVAKIIKFFTKSKFSHVGIAFWCEINNQKRLMIVDAQGGNKRRIVNLSLYANFPMFIIKSPLPWSSYADSALEKLGTVKYSFIEAGYIGFREFLFNSTGIKLPNLHFKGEICSEFVAKLLNLDDVNVSPAALMAKLQKNGAVIYITTYK